MDDPGLFFRALFKLFNDMYCKISWNMIYYFKSDSDIINLMSSPIFYMTT